MSSNTSPEFDAIVVGSGISGGWAAKELTERGLKVLLVERGPHITHREDYSGEDKAPWEMPFAGRIPEEEANRDYFVQKDCYALEGATKKFFVNDRIHQYIHPKEKPVSYTHLTLPTICSV